MRYVARQSSKNPVLHQDVICLQNFTRAWMQPEFWEEYNWFYSEYKKDQQYLKTFEKYGIKFSNILPHSVQGEQCPSQEFEQAKHLFIAGTSILTSDFMKKCNIQSVVFGKRLKINGQPVPNGILYIDGVLYIDQSSRLMMRNIFRQLYIINTENFPEYMKAHIFAETFADLLWNSHRAYKRAKTDNDFYEKVKNIMDLNILRPHAYRTMNLNRIIECR